MSSCFWILLKSPLFSNQVSKYWHYALCIGTKTNTNFRLTKVPETYLYYFPSNLNEPITSLTSCYSFIVPSLLCVLYDELMYILYTLNVCNMHIKFILFYLKDFELCFDWIYVNSAVIIGLMSRGNYFLDTTNDNNFIKFELYMYLHFVGIVISDPIANCSEKFGRFPWMPLILNQAKICSSDLNLKQNIEKMKRDNEDDMYLCRNKTKTIKQYEQ